MIPKFTLQKSFGEVYHLAAAAYFLQQVGQTIAVDFKYEKDEHNEHAKEFFSFLGINLAPSDCECFARNLPETADILFQHFYPGCLSKLADKLRQKGDEEEWSIPFPELEQEPERPKLLIWERLRVEGNSYKQHRNCSAHLLKQLVKSCLAQKNVPVLLVHKKHGIENAIECERYWMRDKERRQASIAEQLWFIDKLFTRYGAAASVGMMSGAMDGPAMFFGHKTIFLASHKDATPRRQKVSIAVPNLIWQQIEYQGNFEQLAHDQLSALEQLLWGNQATIGAIETL